MSRRDTLVLKLAAGWTVLIWAVFVRNLLRDDTRAVGFKVVHLTLAVVSVAFAVAIWRIATRSSRRSGERAGTPS
jgi:hypothetical protein